MLFTMSTSSLRTLLFAIPTVIAGASELTTTTAGSVCTDAPYKSYLPLSTNAAIQSHCAYVFPSATTECGGTVYTTASAVLDAALSPVYTTVTLTVEGGYGYSNRTV